MLSLYGIMFPYMVIYFPYIYEYNNNFTTICWNMKSSDL